MRVLRAAAEEAAEAAAWYESQRAGLGIEFDVAVQTVLDLLETRMPPVVAMPGRASKSRAQRIVMRRLPFDIVVAPTGEGWLVIAFAHHSRRPGYWWGRIPSRG